MFGTIRVYKEDRGFGFLVSRANTKQYFFHINDWQYEEIPVAGDFVEFSTKASKRAGYPVEACEIKKIERTTQATTAIEPTAFDSLAGQNGAEVR
jgi:cold shock CspA family protein